MKKQIGQAIYKYYISEGSQYQVNVSNALREHCERQLNGSQSDSEKYSNSLYDDIEKEVLHLIDDNLMKQFVNSQQYKICQTVLMQLNPRINELSSNVNQLLCQYKDSQQHSSKH